MKRLKFILMMSMLLFCFSLVGCEKDEVLDQEQTISANGTESAIVDDLNIVEIDDIDP